MRMKHPRIGFIVIAMGLLAFASGCATPIERAYTARTLFNAGVQDVLTARQTEVISPENYRIAVTAADEISGILDRVDIAAIEGNPIDFEVLYTSLQHKLRDFLMRAALANKTHGPPVGSTKE